MVKCSTFASFVFFHLFFTSNSVVFVGACARAFLVPGRRVPSLRHCPLNPSLRYILHLRIIHKIIIFDSLYNREYQVHNYSLYSYTFHVCIIIKMFSYCDQTINFCPYTTSNNFYIKCMSVVSVTLLFDERN